MTPVESAVAIVAICSVGSLIIEARAHYLIHKAMHRRVTALMDFSRDSERCESDGKDSEQSKYEQFGHSSLP